jgi:hypothetical protein
MGKPHLCFGTESTKIWCENTKMAPTITLRCQYGFLATHSTMVALVLNVVTSTITPQFHVVFDDMFSTVTLNEKDPLEIWGRLIDCASCRLNALVDNDPM